MATREFASWLQSRLCYHYFIEENAPPMTPAQCASVYLRYTSEELDDIFVAFGEMESARLAREMRDRIKKSRRAPRKLVSAP
jgi:hypothetical protein